MPEWNEETRKQFKRALTAFQRGACFGPQEDKERHANSADALAAALEEIERQDAEIQNLVRTHSEGCDEALREVQEELDKAEKRAEAHLEEAEKQIEQLDKALSEA